MLDRKRVSTDTITGITSSPDFTDAEGVLPAPSAKQIITAVRKQLKAAEQKAVDAVLDRPNESTLKLAMARAQDQLKEFEIIVNNIPTGFDLVPVLYDRISQDDNQKISDEYMQLRQNFLVFVAENHADELKKLGVCAYGINRMKLGLDAADKDGNFYDLSIDHIVERSGCGLWADSKAVDPDQPHDAPRFRTNHFGNFVLLPEKIHHFKNTLNTLQKIAPLKEGDAQWMLMLVPKRNAEFSGFVCAAQKPDYPLHGIDMRAPDAGRKISHVAFTVAQVTEAIERIVRHPELAANDNENAQAILIRAFKDAAVKDKALRRDIENLKPQLAEISQMTRNLFNDLSSKKTTSQEKNDYDSFVRFFVGRKVAKFRESAARLPFKEASHLRKAFNDIGHDIETLRSEHIKTLGVPKPANDDKPENGKTGVKAPQYGKRPPK